VRIWDVEHDRRDFAEFYALARDDCLRVPGSAQTFGGTAGGQLSRSVTGVQRLPPSPGNVARTLVTIPAGFRQYLGPRGRPAAACRATLGARDASLQVWPRLRP
jgi:hypothetical protein